MMNTVSTNESGKEDIPPVYDFSTNEDHFRITPPRKLTFFRESTSSYTSDRKLPSLSVAAVRKITQLEIALAQEKKCNEEMRCELYNQRLISSHSSATNSNNIFSQTRYNQEKVLAVHLSETQAAFEKAEKEIENLKNNIQFVRLSAASEINEVHKNLKSKCQQLQELEDEVIILRDMLKNDNMFGVIPVKSLSSTCQQNSVVPINPPPFSVEQCIHIFLKGNLEQNVHYENTESFVTNEGNSAFSSEEFKRMQLNYKKQMEDLNLGHKKQLEETYSCHRKQLEAIKHDYENQLEDMKVQLDRLREKLSQRDTAMEKIETELKGTCIALTEHERMLKNRSKEISNLQHKLNKREKVEDTLNQLEKKMNQIKDEERDLQNDRSTLIREQQELERKRREILDERQDILIQANELDCARKRVLSHMAVYRQCSKQFSKVFCVRVELFNGQQDNELQERLNTSIGVQNALRHQLSIAQKLVSKKNLGVLEEQKCKNWDGQHLEKQTINPMKDSVDIFLKPQPPNQYQDPSAQNNERHKSRFQLDNSQNQSFIPENHAIPCTNIASIKKPEHQIEQKR
ncbi:microtubule-associated tumor suppressor 1 homolog isoform X2 [Hylaeus volcanicus]|uniref:microtubule-associated tumor suppressor 1 homolog isoform X2 n=1 Tax=Hylaeus volcanicus TaxID=313075 RepID=UPI0023B83719|nr:microtubule-associated tumor suppressor 1 homolog isoform X2 [Hylaeus volcanicus]